MSNLMHDNDKNEPTITFGWDDIYMSPASDGEESDISNVLN